MTCKDCIHFGVCYLPSHPSANTCKRFFKDKSRFVELPCKVGDTFYAVGKSNVREFECLGFKYGLYDGRADAIFLIAISNMEFIFGEEAFLTREEAEKKLKEIT